MTVTVDLLDADGSLNTADLDDARERGWVHPRPRVGLGMGTLTVANDHSLIGDLTPFRLLKWNLDGSFAWLSVIGRTPSDRVAARHADELTILDGPGGLALLGSSDVKGATVEGFRSSGMRVFGWPAPDFDDSGWGEGVFWKQFDDADRPGDQWPDKQASKMLGEALVDGDSTPNHTWYHRRDVDLGEDRTIRVFCWWDNLGTVWVDGDLVTRGRDTWTFERFDVQAEGTHTFAWSLFNKGKPPGGTNPSALMYAGYVLDDDGNLTEQVFRSEPGEGVWTDEPAEVSQGYVWHRLLTAAQDRGLLPGVTWDFTDAQDSFGNDWSTLLPVVSYRDGEHYWPVLRSGLQEFGGTDAEMRWVAGGPPHLELVLWDDRVSASGVTLDDPGTVDAAVASAQTDRKGPGANAVRIETPDGFSWRTDDDRITAEGRRETSAAFGTASSVEEVQTAADELLADERGLVPHNIMTAGPSGKRPYTDFGVASMVGATLGAAVEDHTVESISVTVEDDNDAVTFDLDAEHKL